MPTQHHPYLEDWKKYPPEIFRVNDSRLNPFIEDGVDLLIAMADRFAYGNSKFITVLGLLQGAQQVGALKGVHTLVEATSGNTGLALALLAPAFGIKQVQLIVPKDLPEGKRAPLVLAGAELVSPAANESLNPVTMARNLGGGWNKGGLLPHRDGVLNLDQYANPWGTELHQSFTAPEIARALKTLGFDYPTLAVFGVGTSGTLVGVSKHFRTKFKKVKILGVLLKKGNEIPGVRDREKMKYVGLPWEECSDVIVEIATRPSYLASLWFQWVMGLMPGPSSGFAYMGALKYLAEQKSIGTLDALRNKHGRIVVIIFFPDGSRPYSDRYAANLLTSQLSKDTAPLPINGVGSG